MLPSLAASPSIPLAPAPLLVGRTASDLCDSQGGGHLLLPCCSRHQPACLADGRTSWPADGDIPDYLHTHLSVPDRGHTRAHAEWENTSPIAGPGEEGERMKFDDESLTSRYSVTLSVCRLPVLTVSIPIPEVPLSVTCRPACATLYSSPMTKGRVKRRESRW